MSDLLRIIYAMMAHAIILRLHMVGFQSPESRFPICWNVGFQNAGHWGHGARNTQIQENIPGDQAYYKPFESVEAAAYTANHFWGIARIVYARHLLTEYDQISLAYLDGNDLIVDGYYDTSDKRLQHNPNFTDIKDSRIRKIHSLPLADNVRYYYGGYWSEDEVSRDDFEIALTKAEESPGGMLVEFYFDQGEITELYYEFR